MRSAKTILRLLLLLIGIYIFLRACFLISYFSETIGSNELLKIFYWGLRLDLSAIILVNLPLWIWLLFVDPYIKNEWTRYIISFTLLLICNVPFLALNIIDLGYFKFDLRRSTVDLFSVLKDSEHAWGMFFGTYWYLLFLFLGLSLLLGMIGGRILQWHQKIAPAPMAVSKQRNWITVVGILLLFALLVRGWNVRPLTPATPLLHLPAQYQPLCENSTITFLYSLIRHQTLLEEKKYFTDDELDKMFTIRRQYPANTSLQKKNVIVFVLESFSKRLIQNGGKEKAKTPFLDSLMRESIVCSNAFANGLESNKGLVALLAGIPPLMDEAYYNSSYSNNPFRGIGTILKEEGYTTKFFMGASPDHFGFGKLCKLVGIDHYYSEKEYGNPKDHDGNWGIFDHKFLPYAASVIKQNTPPTFSVIFNVSSHHPFKLPAHLQNQFTIPGQDAEQNSISYVDYSLRLFFDSIRSTDWYKNSIFVFVADHALTFDIKPRSVLRTAFEIPFFLHIPGSSAVQIDKTVQQLDLVPTILDQLHYKRAFMSFGRSIFDSTDAFAINKIFGTVQLIRGDYLLGYDEKNEKVSYFYNFRTDPALKENLTDNNSNQESKSDEIKLKAFLQRFNNSLLKHELLIEK